MDPISAALNIIGVVSKIKDMIDKVSENREMCRKLCGRLEVLSYLFAKANSDLMQQPETKRIVFQVNEFIENAHQFIIQLLPRANRRGKRSMVSKLQTRVSEIRSFIKAAKKSKTNGAKLAEMFETLNFFVLTLSPMLLLYNSQKQSTNSPALVLEATKAAEILQAFAVDIRNTLIKSVNTMMMEAHCGAALPEDIDILPSCVEEVNAAILELAATLGVHSVELPPLAASAAQTKLKSFVEKKVVEIRFVSQSMAGKAAAVSASFPDDDQDISVCFESCGGLNDDRLGKVGGFGVTYKRRYKPTGKVYALKEVNVGFASSRGLTEDRLLMEVETLQVICHPNIVRCHHSYFSDDGLRFYLVMELVDGQTFDQVLRSQSYNPDPEKLVKWLKQLASALVYMHEDCNIVHRDLKPENVMVTRGMGDIKLIDFGMARFMPASLSDPASITMTAAIGTQFYMSYAKKNGEMYDGRDDVWAVGCIILEMLLGISVVSQKALCDEDTMRASLLQEAKQRHGGIGALLETVLGSKLNGTIPYAAVLLIMASDVQVLSSSAVESVADSFNKLPGAKPTLSESSTSKAGAKTELVQWLLSNVPGFTDKDAVDCADNCVEIGCNTIDLVCEEFVMRMSESESVADELVGLLVSSVPLRRRLRQTLWTHTSTRATPLPAMASAPPASTGGVISEDIGNPPVSTPACTSSPSAIRATEVGYKHNSFSCTIPKP
ncbi:serine/threonine-protein kinase [archaeon]|nr:MAG: serine/threonine-protein kinase [archaeon]